jgi:3-oxoacyl-(acyl-carrier-protein) synthase
MNQFSILAASHLGPSGYGNDLTGLRPWPMPLADALRRGEMDKLHWCDVCTSESSRFGRMDVLSRLGLMAVELLDAGLPELEPAQREAVGVCVETRSGSLVADCRFLQMPLASTFAYTLPSTVVGEICIRHRFRGPVMCLLPGSRQAGSLETALGWLKRGQAEVCVCVACDFVNKEVAARLPLPDDMPSGGWQGCAILVGRSAGHDRRHPWHAGLLANIAQALCLGRTESK